MTSAVTDLSKIVCNNSRSEQYLLICSIENDEKADAAHLTYVTVKYMKIYFLLGCR